MVPIATTFPQDPEAGFVLGLSRGLAFCELLGTSSILKHSWLDIEQQARAALWAGRVLTDWFKLHQRRLQIVIPTHGITFSHFVFLPILELRLLRMRFKVPAA